jgi:hypothetical protein
VIPHYAFETSHAFVICAEIPLLHLSTAPKNIKGMLHELFCGKHTGQRIDIESTIAYFRTSTTAFLPFLASKT